MITCKGCDKEEICAIGGYSVAEKCHREQERIRERMINLMHIENTRKQAATRQKKLQDELWKKMHEQWSDDFRIEDDVESFTDSEEMDIMMQSYQNELISVISGLEEKLPDWYGPEVKEE